MWVQISYQIITWLCVGIELFMLSMYIYEMRKQMMKHIKNYGIKNNLLVICTILCFIFIIGSNILAGIEMNMGYYHCTLRVILFVYFWALARFFLYNVFILRLDVVFEGSAFSYSSLFLFTIRILIFIWLISTGCMILFYIHGKKTNFSDCTFWMENWATFGVPIFNLIFSFMCLGLFLRPLKKLMNNRGDDSLFQLAIKSTVLTAVSALSNFIVIGILSINQSIFHLARIDDLITCICLLFMNSAFDTYYKIFCGCCDCCCGYHIAVAEKIISKKAISGSIQIGSSSPFAGSSSPYADSKDSKDENLSNFSLKIEDS